MKEYEQTIIEFPLPLPEWFIEQVDYRHGGRSGGRRGEAAQRGGRRDRQGEGQIAGALTARGTHDAGAEASSTAGNGVVHFKAYAHLVSVDPDKNRCRFYTLTWQPSLFGGLALVRSWGRIGTSGRWRAIFFADQESAQKTVEEILKRRLGHGYAVVRWK